VHIKTYKNLIPVVEKCECKNARATFMIRKTDDMRWHSRLCNSMSCVTNVGRAKKVVIILSDREPQIYVRISTNSC